MVSLSGNELIFKSYLVPYAETLWAVNDVVDLSVIVYDVYKTENRVIVYDYPMLSDAEAVEYVSTVFEVTDSTMDNIDFIATDGMFDVDFAWSSSNAAVINEYGVVSQPVFGEADAVVTLTVVFTKGVETTTVTITNTGERFYSPLVRSMASEEGIEMTELESIPGSGKEGRVTKSDMVSYLKTRGSAPATAQVKTETKKIRKTDTNLYLIISLSKLKSKSLFVFKEKKFLFSLTSIRVFQYLLYDY